MANSNLTVANLDFSSIKSSLKTYLSGQTVLKDFGWSEEARAELLNTLMEVDIVRKKQPDGSMGS